MCLAASIYGKPYSDTENAPTIRVTVGVILEPIHFPLLFTSPQDCARQPSFSYVMKELSAVILTALISYSTRSLAGRLAGGLALAASALFHGVL